MFWEDPIKPTSPVNISKVVFSVQNTVSSFGLQGQGIHKWLSSAEGWKRIETNSNVIKDDGAGSEVWGQISIEVDSSSVCDALTTFFFVKQFQTLIETRADFLATVI